jgi:hypothetical protein
MTTRRPWRGWLATEERLRAGDLIAELNSRARRIGLNTTDWPGLTMYRFEARPLSLATHCGPYNT